VAYALQRVGDPRAAPALLMLARTAGVYSAAFGLRSAGGTAEGVELAQRFAIDASADARVRTSAVRALGRPGSVAGAGTLLTLLGTKGLSDTLVLETVNALSATMDARAFVAMLDRLADPRPQVRAAAIAGAARVDPERFLLVVSSLGPDREWSVRAALATTLGTLEPDSVRSGLIELTEDQDQRVRGPALAALARVGAPDLDARLVAALEAPDYVVRSTAARILGERKTTSAVPALTRAYERGLSDAVFDGRAAAVVALAAIGGDEALAVVRRALSDRDWPVRWRASDLLQRAGDLAAAPVRPAPLRQPAAFFESAALLHPSFTPVAFIETRYGTIEIALNVIEAPLTTLNFMELARSGFFNGLRVHRLVPNFVAQTGDPRGDGEGGPGFSIPDELSTLPFVRGTVGMALSWRDTGGSQFFITHSPQPHLDGRYTVFGHVVRGMDVVDQLTIHDVIARVRIWDGVTVR
jgi:cyclophilin family peptidyl-prolyl cis-trans isomerase/HEAT repeat protein